MHEDDIAEHDGDGEGGAEGGARDYNGNSGGSGIKMERRGSGRSSPLAEKN